MPSYLNELSPDDVRGTLPGFAYQLGNLLVSWTAFAMATIAHAHGGNYAIVQSIWIAVVAVLLALLTWFGPEARGARFGVTQETGGATMHGSPTSA